MGIEDRDYMRERQRGRSAAGTFWNDRKARVETSGAWFEPKNRGQHFQKDRWRPGTKVRVRPANGMLLLLCAASPLVGLYSHAKRAGWLPDARQELPFPQTGDVTVNGDIDPLTATASFSVRTADANAVAQLYTLTGMHVLSLYVRKNDDVTTRVPPGTYRVRIAEGQRWFGPSHFFGNSMSFETVAEEMSFTRRKGERNRPEPLGQRNPEDEAEPRATLVSTPMTLAIGMRGVPSAGRATSCVRALVAMGGVA